MKVNQRTHNIVLIFFVLTTVVGLAVLFKSLGSVQAATVNVNARVAAQCGNGILETGEQCDGSAGAGNCYNNTCNANCTCPVCGNGVVEAGEACETNAQCPTGQTCNSSCQCQVTSTTCVPGSIVCTWGPCVNNVQTGACTNGCSMTTTSRSCVPPPVCGNHICEPPTETSSNCPIDCPPVGLCGNGVLDPGEQCDDGNTVSGDCCSSTCQIELLISNVSAVPQLSSATIGWRTQCQVTQSVLEWGRTTAMSDGSISGLSGQSYSQIISSLQPQTVYYYKITATAGALQSAYSGSFRTLGGIEICNNGIDDNGNGYCDYPASTCTDGSIPGDPACTCTPSFACTHGTCGADNKWTVTCVDQTVPKCMPDYQYQETCNICQGKTCGTCQQLDPQTCTCQPTANCCGNGTCEPPAESPSTCPLDCPVSCLSNWQCGPWQPTVCPASGIQTRTCLDTNGCTIPINEPPTSQTCGGTVCPGLTCGAGQTINPQTCTCEKIVPYCGNNVCEVGETSQNCPQDCVAICTPNWTTGAWSPCINGVQTREVNDLNKCNLDFGKPPTVRACGTTCQVACGTCQKIDTVSCSCYTQTPCCGNGICDPGETNWSCPVDCGIPPDHKPGPLPQCMDGIDNDGDGLIDYPADPACSSPYGPSEFSAAKLLKNIQAALVKNVIENQQVQQANQAVAAPVLISTIAVNTFTSFSFFNFATYLQYFFTQPFAVFFRRRRRKWGVVYDSLTKQPIDLAIVRLYQKENNRLIQSRVTDRQGRYSFLAAPGTYYLTVTKPQYVYPTLYLKDAKEDVKYLDVYHGEDIVVTDERADITVNIPVDSQVPEKPVRKVIIQYYLRRVQSVLAFSSVPLAALSMIISPGALTYALFGANCLLYVLFRRLGYQKPPKNWGIVYDEKTKKPLGRAITRIYDKKYNKLLETRLTDARGRYTFLVNNNVYYVTAEKPGYDQYRSSDIDLISKSREALVNVDIALAAGKGGVMPPVSPAAPTVPTPPPVSPVPPASVPPISPAPVPPPTTPTTPSSAVGRESLQELLQTKESIKHVATELQETEQHLEQIEEKVDAIEKKIETGQQAKPVIESTSTSVTTPERSQAQTETVKTNAVAKKITPKKRITKKPPASTDTHGATPPDKSIFG